MVTRIRARRLAALVPLLLPAAAFAGEEPEPQVSNYGFMQTTTADGEAVPLPLEHTEVAATVSGFLASVEVVQRFGNPFPDPIEAVYVFPLPQRAAVYAMEMQVGDRRIKGMVKKRAEARAVYEQAKAAGKTASLLTQERPNVFTQSVANILPGDTILVTLRYAEDLRYDRGAYEFVFPMVVGPRYVGGGVPTGKAGTGWSPDTSRIPDASRITPPLLKKGLRPGNDIMVTLQVDAGMPIRNVFAPSHRVSKAWAGKERVTVALAQGDTIPNRDFVVRYEVDGDRPEAALLAHHDERGGHFLMMVQPSADVADGEVAPREYVFVVDTSGSMSGFPLQQAKRVMKRCLDGMRRGDSFQVVTFAGSARRLFPKAVEATRANVKAAEKALSHHSGGGGTEFLPALELALRSPADPQRARVVLFITDGYIGYEGQVLEYVQRHLGDANVFPLGVGSAVNRFLIDGMARIGLGEPSYILNDESPDPLVKRFYEYVSKPSLTSIDVDWGGLDVEALTPGRLPDLFAERPLFVMGRYGRGGTGTVRIRGKLGGRSYEEKLEVSLPEGAAARDHEAIPYLWARRTISDLMDVWRTAGDRREETEEAVTELALEYQLMSQFTSFVAVDETVRNPDGSPRTVAVPVPLPEGVSEDAAPSGAFAAGYGGGGVAMPRMKMKAPSPAPVMGEALSIGGRFNAGADRGSGRLGGLRGPRSASAARPTRPAPEPLAAADADDEREEQAGCRLELDDGALTVVGTASVDDLLPGLRTAVAALATCSSGKVPRPGRIKLRLTVAANGRVTDVRIVAAADPAPSFNRKLRRAIAAWRLKATGTEQVVVVTLWVRGA